jgi:hypothetical protein
VVVASEGRREVVRWRENWRRRREAASADCERADARRVWRGRRERRMGAERKLSDATSCFDEGNEVAATRNGESGVLMKDG